MAPPPGSRGPTCPGWLISHQPQRDPGHVRECAHTRLRVYLCVRARFVQPACSLLSAGQKLQSTAPGLGACSSTELHKALQKFGARRLHCFLVPASDHPRREAEVLGRVVHKPLGPLWAHSLARAPGGLRTPLGPCGPPLRPETSSSPPSTTPSPPRPWAVLSPLPHPRPSPLPHQPVRRRGRTQGWGTG